MIRLLALIGLLLTGFSASAGAAAEANDAAADQSVNSEAAEPEPGQLRFDKPRLRLSDLNRDQRAWRRMWVSSFALTGGLLVVQAVDLGFASQNRFLHFGWGSGLAGLAALPLLPLSVVSWIWMVDRQGRDALGPGRDLPSSFKVGVLRAGAFGMFAGAGVCGAVGLPLLIANLATPFFDFGPEWGWLPTGAALAIAATATLIAAEGRRRLYRQGRWRLPQIRVSAAPSVGPKGFGVALSGSF